MRVVDASVLVDVLVAGHRRDAAVAAMRGESLAAPSFIDVEVTSAVARLEREGTLDREQAGAAVYDLAVLPMRRVDTSLLLLGAWSIRDRLRISDAFYISCAQLLGAPLLTSDARLTRSAVTGVTFHVVA